MIGAFDLDVLRARNHVAEEPAKGDVEFLVAGDMHHLRGHGNPLRGIFGIELHDVVELTLEIVGTRSEALET